MDVIEIRHRKVGEDDEGCETWVDGTVLHRNTTVEKVRQEYYPNYKLEPRHATVPKSLNSNVLDVQRYDIVPQKEKAHDPHAPRYDVESQLIEVPR
jgi:hypothetical protein